MIAADAFPALRGPLDLDVAHGEIVLLEGPNGSGKTSLLRALAGLDAPFAPARVRLREEGADPRALDAPRLAALVALGPQDARDALVGLTVSGEMRLRGLALPGALAPLALRECATLSSGEARRVALAATRARGAPLLLLDEPAEGLDAEAREDLRALVLRAREQGAVVAADHSGLLDGLATRVVHLAPQDDAPLPPVPRREGPIVLRADARIVRRDGARVRLPALALGPGFHAARGPNGCGKSTLLLRLAGLLDSEGVLVDDRAPRAGENARLALPHAADAFARERVRHELAGADPEVARALVPHALLDRHPLALSGGEAQRVLLAKTLGHPARAFLLDEPEAHLDAAGRAALARVVARRVAEGACVLAATHDPALLALAHETIALGAEP